MYRRLGVPVVSCGWGGGVGWVSAVLAPVVWLASSVHIREGVQLSQATRLTGGCLEAAGGRCVCWADQNVPQRGQNNVLDALGQGVHVVRRRHVDFHFTSTPDMASSSNIGQLRWPLPRQRAESAFGARCE